MRVIGAGLAVFLAVTAILLYQMSSGGGETFAIAVIPTNEPTTVSTQPPSPSPTPEPTHAAPTETKTAPPPTATATATTPDEPVVDPTATESYVEEIVTEEIEVAESEDVDDLAEPEAADEPDTIEEDDSASYLAGVDPTDAWSGVIQTPNGGIIGMVLSGLANVRTLPTVDAEIVGELHSGWPVAIYGVVSGEFVSGTDVWYQVGGGYISAALIGPYIPAVPDVTYSGHWVDVDLTHNVAVAYIDDTPVNAVIVISGKDGFETPLGEHTIFARVESETLDSATVGIPKGDPEYYYLPDVPYTQYFASGGFAIHANYWSDPWQFGSSTSHGCINMFADDAAWFWWFLDIGSVVNVHY